MNDEMESRKNRTAFGIGSLGSGVVNTMITAYFMFYLTQFQKLSGTVVGTFFLLSKLFDAFNDPIMGAIVCNTRSRWGRYRPWLLIGPAAAGIFFILMFTNINASLMGRYVFYFSMYVMWSIANTIQEIPYWALIPALTKNQELRNKMTSNCQIFSGFSTILVSVLMPQVLSLLSPKMEMETIYLVSAIVLAVVLIGCFAITATVAKDNSAVFDKKVTTKEVFMGFKKNDQARKIFVPILLLVVAYNLTLGLGTYFFAYDVGSISKFSIYMLFVGLGVGVAFLTYVPLVKRIGKKSLFTFSCLLCIVGYGLTFTANIIWHGNVWVLSGLSFVALMGWGWINISKIIMLADVADYSEVKTGERMESVWVSLMSFINKFGAALVALFVGVALDVAKITGLNPQTDVAVVDSFGLVVMEVMMFIVPMILICIALMVYMQFYKLDDKNQKWRKEISDVAKSEEN